MAKKAKLAVVKENKKAVKVSQYRAARTVILSVTWEGELTPEMQAGLEKQWNDFLSAVTFGTDFSLTPLGSGFKIQKIGEKNVEEVKEE